VRDDLVFFPQLLQKAGYETAFIGKWHMGGEGDEPQRGFDHWISFRGQGQYFAKGPGALNIDGKRSPQPGYVTDDLTDFATEWISLRKDKPFFLYLSHKAVHADFVPADRHKGRYQDREIKLPASHADTRENYAGKPRWVKDQRNSWHGVDYPYHSALDVKEYYKRYCETMLAVDDSVGRLLAQLEKNGVLDSTLVVVMGDNGFLFGEHGLIDKRNAYEESMRVPLVMRYPTRFKAGTSVSQVVANIDIAPTLLAVAGLPAPPVMQGTSFLPLARGESMPWREHFLYEYYWERNFPQTPTIHALRGERFKYIRYQGIWDIDELYDLQADPAEMNNLINDPAHAETVRKMNCQLFKTLAETDGLKIPLLQDRGSQMNKRTRSGSAPGDFNKVLVE
ncbi:MAG: Choline-sulfatase, partial [Verrucomicrobiota bacterium]